MYETDRQTNNGQIDRRTGAALYAASLGRSHNNSRESFRILNAAHHYRMLYLPAAVSDLQLFRLIRHGNMLVSGVRRQPTVNPVLPPRVLTLTHVELFCSLVSRDIIIYVFSPLTRNTR